MLASGIVVRLGPGARMRCGHGAIPDLLLLSFCHVPSLVVAATRGAASCSSSQRLMEQTPHLLAHFLAAHVLVAHGVTASFTQLLWFLNEGVGC